MKQSREREKSSDKPALTTQFFACLSMVNLLINICPTGLTMRTPISPCTDSAQIGTLSKSPFHYLWTSIFYIIQKQNFQLMAGVAFRNHLIIFSLHLSQFDARKERRYVEKSILLGRMSPWFLFCLFVW